MALSDAVGTEHGVAGDDARIVSLVPSVTELLCDLGLASQLVGRTGFCIHPREIVRGIPKVGGTKDVAVERIRELAPTHVVVNIDENRKETVEELAEFVSSVVVTHPLGPETTSGSTGFSAASSAAPPRPSACVTSSRLPTPISRPIRDRRPGCSTSSGASPG